MLAAALAAAASVGACVGTIGDGGSAGSAGSGPGVDGGVGTTSSALCQGPPTPGSAPLRRLTQSEYNNSVRDLLGDTSRPADTFPPDQQVGDFSNTAVSLTVPPLLAQAYQSAAEALASTALSHLSSLLPCDPTTGEDACAAQFISTFGKRAYRRPLAPDEQTALVGLYASNKTGADFNNGVQAVIEAVLQSAPFLYRVEYGDVSQAAGTVVPLTPYEMASRLSYLLWDSMPDDTLFTAADANQLATPAQLATQARRMLTDSKAHPAVQQFFTEWLGLAHLVDSSKDPATYPEFTPTLHQSMQGETSAFIDWMMWQSDAKLPTLLTSPVTFVNQELASVYGFPGVTGTALQQVSLDPTQRAGILTQLSVMTVLAKPDRTSPVLRGRFVRQNLFCQPIPPPPTNIVITPPPVTPGVSTREAFSMHSSVEPCKSCHKQMDPIGFGFENYDGVGKFRTTDQGQPVDPSGALTGTDSDGKFPNAVALATKLAQSQEVSDCVTTEWFRYAFGRGESNDDSCSLGTLKQAFTASGTNFQELLVAITQTDAFRYRPEVTP